MDINEIILEKVRRVKHVALDMDGTIYNGGTLFPFTIGFLDKMKELGIGYSFLTNNPSRSTNDYLIRQLWLQSIISGCIVLIVSGFSFWGLQA